MAVGRWMEEGTVSPKESVEQAEDSRTQMQFAAGASFFSNCYRKLPVL